MQTNVLIQDAVDDVKLAFGCVDEYNLLMIKIKR